MKAVQLVSGAIRFIMRPVVEGSQKRGNRNLTTVPRILSMKYSITVFNRAFQRMPSMRSSSDFSFEKAATVRAAGQRSEDIRTDTMNGFECSNTSAGEEPEIA